MCFSASINYCQENTSNKLDSVIYNLLLSLLLSLHFILTLVFTSYT